MTSAIIVDDEPNLSQYLQTRLAAVWPELEIAGTAINGRQAIALAAQVQPDVAFLDIQMPGLTGLEVAQALPQDTQIVFVTAFDQYAVDAFDRAAVDYLLKPVSDERLALTVERLKQAAKPDRAELLAVIEQISTVQTGDYLQWINAGLDDTTQLIDVNEVIYFQADQKYTTVRTESAEHFVRKSIKDLESQLDPAKFWRIHRGTIVQVSHIASAKRDIRGRYTLTLRGCKEKLLASQSYGHLFKQM